MATDKTPKPVNFDDVYEDEVAAADAGVLFQPGYVPQKGRKATIIDLDPPGQPHWLAGERPAPTEEEE